METLCNGVNIALHLEPFIHQVGGHSSLFCLNKDTICKPLLLQELKFYENCPTSLEAFVPEFKGVVDVQYDIDSDGYLNLTTCLPSNCKVEDESLNRKMKEVEIKYRIKQCDSSTIQIESNSTNSDSPQFGTERSLLNPWVHHCHQELQRKIDTSILSQKYILLENLVSRYDFPCILDIKVGTRSYGHDANATKRKSQTAKAASTTTSSLGLRIMGIQVYQPDSGNYICQNKYYGRTLTSSTFQQALQTFFNNNTDSTMEILTELLVKIQKLKESIENLQNYRFFGSSLLIVYSGTVASSFEHVQKNGHHTNLSEMCDINGTTKSERFVTVKLIDFAHTVLPKMEVYKGTDDGCIFGLDNLIRQLKMLL